MFTKSIMNGTMAIAMFAMVLTGCESGTTARRIDPNGTQTITTISGLDIQDATDAASALATSLLESGKLGANGKPSVIAISRYVNNTSQQIDRDRIIKKLRVVLNKAGVAKTTTTIGLGAAEDPLAKQEQDVNNFLNETKQVRPDYTLTFKILDNIVKAGKTRQVTYIFQMSLTDTRTGLAEWEEEKRITKQGTKPAVGW